jgi:hypothetical protein
MLVLSQVLKIDVPAYQNMPKDKEEKLAFLRAKLKQLLAPNFNSHRQVIYPALIEWCFSDAVLLDELRQEEDEILETIHALKEADDMQLHEIGILIEELVRKKERQLYEKMQQEFGDKLSELELN